MRNTKNFAISSFSFDAVSQSYKRLELSSGLRFPALPSARTAKKAVMARLTKMGLMPVQCQEEDGQYMPGAKVHFKPAFVAECEKVSLPPTHPPTQAHTHIHTRAHTHTHARAHTERDTHKKAKR